VNRIKDKVADHKQREAKAGDPGNDALRPIIIKLKNAELISRQSASDDVGHQITGYHEKYIDAGKSAGDEGNVEMVKNDRRDRQSAKGIYVVSEFCHDSCALIS
jgi:hypothetical protein